MNNEVRTAVIGLGNVGKSTHVPILKNHPDAELVAICDIDEETLIETANEYDVTGYNNYETMFANEDIDSVHVTTPPHTHLSVARDAITHGAHTLIEKPVTTSLEDLDELIEVSKKHDPMVSVVHNQLYFRCTQEALSRVEAGEIGDVTSVTMLFCEPRNLNETPRGDWVFDLPGGEIGEGLVHQVYLPLAFVDGLGELRYVSKQNFHKYEGAIDFDGLAINLLDSSESRMVNINVTTNSANKNELHIQGTDGELRLDILKRDVINTMTGTESEMSYSKIFLLSSASGIFNLTRNLLEKVQQQLQRKLRTALGHEDTMYHLSHYWYISEYLTAVQEGNDPPVSLEEAYETIEVLSAIGSEM